MGKQSGKTKIDLYVINKVRSMRLAKKLTQTHLAVHLQVSIGFIGHIESPNFVAKYSVSQLNALAKLLKCSPKDFWPEKPL